MEVSYRVAVFFFLTPPSAAQDPSCVVRKKT
jgi:hypothetical protein